LKSAHFLATFEIQFLESRTLSIPAGPAVSFTAPLSEVFGFVKKSSPKKPHPLHQSWRFTISFCISSTT